MENAVPFPLDFTQLERGSIVPAEVIQQWHGHVPDTREYRLDQMNLASLIRDYFREDRGDVVTVRMARDTLAILTHEQQNEWVPRAQRMALRAFARRHVEDQGIDANQLSAESQQRRDERLRKNSWLLQQFRRKPPPALPGKTPS